ELAAPNVTAADMARLEQMIGEIDQDIATNNPAGYLRRNEKFHFLIYERARSPQMLRIIQDLWTQVGPFFNSLFDNRTYIADANVGHRKIIAAIRSGDPSAVRDAVVWDNGGTAESLM